MSDQTDDLVSLAKVADEHWHVHLILRYLQQKNGAAVTRESAALAVGLLRRSGESQKFGAKTVDLCRSHLNAAVADDKASDRVRSFSALSLGMLADQPYGGGALAANGRLVTRVLWRHLETKHAGEDLPVALLTALGMQPPKGVPDGVREDLQAIVEIASQAATIDMYSEYEARNGQALKALVEEHGVELRQFPEDVLIQLRELTGEVLEEIADSDPMARRVWDSLRAYSEQVQPWTAMGEQAIFNAR